MGAVDRFMGAADCEAGFFGATGPAASANRVRTTSIGASGCWFVGFHRMSAPFRRGVMVIGPTAAGAAPATAYTGADGPADRPFTFSSVTR